MKFSRILVTGGAGFLGASLVPLLLRRAQKMAKMDFMQAMQELALATPDQLRPSLGSVIDDLLASAAPPPSS